MPFSRVPSGKGQRLQAGIMSLPSAVSPNLSTRRGLSTAQDEVPLDVSQGLWKMLACV